MSQKDPLTQSDSLSLNAEKDKVAVVLTQPTDQTKGTAKAGAVEAKQTPPPPIELGSPAWNQRVAIIKDQASKIPEEEQKKIGKRAWECLVNVVTDEKSRATINATFGTHLVISQIIDTFDVREGEIFPISGDLLIFTLNFIAQISPDLKKYVACINPETLQDLSENFSDFVCTWGFAYSISCAIANIIVPYGEDVTGFLGTLLPTIITTFGLVLAIGEYYTHKYSTPDSNLTKFYSAIGFANSLSALVNLLLTEFILPDQDDEDNFRTTNITTVSAFLGLFAIGILVLRGLRNCQSDQDQIEQLSEDEHTTRIKEFQEKVRRIDEYIDLLVNPIPYYTSFVKAKGSELKAVRDLNMVALFKNFLPILYQSISELLGRAAAGEHLLAEGSKKEYQALVEPTPDSKAPTPKSSTQPPCCSSWSVWGCLSWLATPITCCCRGGNKSNTDDPATREPLTRGALKPDSISLR